MVLRITAVRLRWLLISTQCMKNDFHNFPARHSLTGLRSVDKRARAHHYFCVVVNRLTCWLIIKLLIINAYYSVTLINLLVCKFEFKSLDVWFMFVVWLHADLYHNIVVETVCLSGRAWWTYPLIFFLFALMWKNSCFLHLMQKSNKREPVLLIWLFVFSPKATLAGKMVVSLHLIFM